MFWPAITPGFRDVLMKSKAFQISKLEQIVAQTFKYFPTLLLGSKTSNEDGRLGRSFASIPD